MQLKGLFTIVTVCDVEIVISFVVDSGFSFDRDSLDSHLVFDVLESVVDSVVSDVVRVVPVCDH